MSHSNDVNNIFSQLASYLLMGGMISWFFTGNSSGLTIAAMLYFMLVATNAIKRGETARSKR